MTTPEIPHSQGYEPLEAYRKDYATLIEQYIPNLTPEQLDGVADLANFLAAERERLYDHDPKFPELLTPKAFKENLDKQLIQSARVLEGGGKPEPLTIVFIDLDNFKVTNDKVGHDTGDLVLAAVIEVLESEIRPGDLMGRYGSGDELILGLKTNVDGAVRAAERYRLLIPDAIQVFVPEMRRAGIIQTISSGIASLPELIPDHLLSNPNIRRQVIRRLGNEHYRNEVIGNLYNQADKALYQGAKYIGKNRTGIMMPDGTVMTAYIIPDPNNPDQTIINYSRPEPIK